MRKRDTEARKQKKTPTSDCAFKHLIDQMGSVYSARQGEDQGYSASFTSAGKQLTPNEKKTERRNPTKARTSFFCGHTSAEVPQPREPEASAKQHDQRQRTVKLRDTNESRSSPAERETPKRA